jgi:hypothetical protein
MSFYAPVPVVNLEIQPPAPLPLFPQLSNSGESSIKSPTDTGSMPKGTKDIFECGVMINGQRVYHLFVDFFKKELEVLVHCMHLYLCCSPGDSTTCTIATFSSTFQFGREFHQVSN